MVHKYNWEVQLIEYRLGREVASFNEWVYTKNNFVKSVSTLQSALGTRHFPLLSFSSLA